MKKIDLNGFELIGIKLDHKTSNENGQSNTDCGKLWREFETGNFQIRIPGRTNDEVIAVYYGYEGDHTDPFSYFIGCKVEPGTETPKDMIRLAIPDGIFIKTVARGRMPSCIADAWKEIWQNQSNRKYDFDFEVYDERSKDWTDAEVDVYVSVK